MGGKHREVHGNRNRNRKQHESCPKRIRMSNLDCVTVKGKTVGIKVYELVGRKATATLTETNHSHGTVFQILKERCDKYIENPPPPDWDGSEKMNAIKTFH